MLALIRTLAPPILSLVFMMIANGLFNTFVSLRLEMEDYRPLVIGMVISSFYGGIVFGSAWIDRWVLKVGHIRSFTILGVVLACLVLIQAAWIAPWYWICLRFLEGICIAGVFVIIESWLLMQTSPSTRGGVLAIYIAASYGALSFGQLLINIAPVETHIPFLLTAGLACLSLAPLFVSKAKNPETAEATKISLKQLYRICPLGFIGGIISGMILAISFGLAPVYAREIGLNISQVGTYMAMLIFGGFIFQLPVGKWADYVDRRKVIILTCFIATILSLAIGLWPKAPYYWQLTLVALFGGFSFSAYPLSMAYACEQVKQSEIVAATGGFVLSYGIGSITGPLLAPFSMDYFGPSGLFYFFSFILLSLAVIGLLSPRKKLE